jgi:hypothetical protein
VKVEVEVEMEVEVKVEAVEATKQLHLAHLEGLEKLTLMKSSAFFCPRIVEEN